MIFYKSELNQALTLISHAIKKSPILVMECALIDVESQTITGYDLEIGITKKISIDRSMTDTVKRFMLPERLIALISKFDNEEIQISIENNVLEVKNGKYKGSFQTISYREYPELPKPEEMPQTINLEFEKLQYLIESTIYAINENSLQPTLTGLLIEIKDGVLKCVGCDGMRIALNQCEIDNQNLSAIIPKKTASIIQKLNSNGNLSIAKSQNHVFFNVGDIQIISRLISGQYIDYASVIPPANPKIAIIEVSMFRNLINRFNIMMNYQNKTIVPIELTVNENVVNITANSTQGVFNEEMEITTQNIVEPLKIGFNPKYLLDVLTHSLGEKIQIAFDTALSPAVCHSLIESENSCALILPVRLKG